MIRFALKAFDWPGLWASGIVSFFLVVLAQIYVFGDFRIELLVHLVLIWLAIAAAIFFAGYAAGIEWWLNSSVYDEIKLSPYKPTEEEKNEQSINLQIYPDRPNDSPLIRSVNEYLRNELEKTRTDRET